MAVDSLATQPEQLLFDSSSNEIDHGAKAIVGLEIKAGNKRV